MKLIVGLGNPGQEYSLTRHNVGFLTLNAFAKNNSINVGTTKFNSSMGKGLISGVPVILAKPQTFMNLSGTAVRDLVNFFKLEIEDMIVIHDDLDLSFGHVRIKSGGGDGGHKGLGSIISHLRGSDFVRVRLGIGKPIEKEMVEKYVLQRFAEDELEMLPQIISQACKAVDEIISSGAQAAMNKFNVRVTKISSKEVGA